MAQTSRSVFLGKSCWSPSGNAVYTETQKENQHKEVLLSRFLLWVTDVKCWEMLSRYCTIVSDLRYCLSRAGKGIYPFLLPTSWMRTLLTQSWVVRISSGLSQGATLMTSENPSNKQVIERARFWRGDIGEKQFRLNVNLWHRYCWNQRWSKDVICMRSLTQETLHIFWLFMNHIWITTIERSVGIYTK